MPRSRQLALMRSVHDEETGESTMEPLGKLPDLVEAFAEFNTAPDGSDRSEAAMEVLHGPGMIVEIPRGHREVTQAMVTLNDDDIAWPVLFRLCKKHGWTMVDLESGRAFA